jgi:hypothetical protein
MLNIYGESLVGQTASNMLHAHMAAAASHPRRFHLSSAGSADKSVPDLCGWLGGLTSGSSSMSMASKVPTNASAESSWLALERASGHDSESRALETSSDQTNKKVRNTDHHTGVNGTHSYKTCLTCALKSHMLQNKLTGHTTCETCASQVTKRFDVRVLEKTGHARATQGAWFSQILHRTGQTLFQNMFIRNTIIPAVKWLSFCCQTWPNWTTLKGGKK